MTKKRFMALVLTFLLVASFSGCDFFSNLPFLSKEEPDVEIEAVPDPNFPVEVGGATIDSRPERVVILSPSLLTKVEDLGLGGVVVGVPDFATGYNGIALCGTPQLPNVENIEAEKTDLLITSQALSEEDAERLAENGVDILVLEGAIQLEDVWQIYKDIALALEGKENGKDIGDDFTGELSDWFDQLAASTAGAEPVTVAYVRQLDFNIATGDSLEGQLLAALSFNNIGEPYTDWIYPTSDDSTSDAKEDFSGVDILFIGEPTITVEMLEENAFYKTLPAVVKDRCFNISYTAMEQQSLAMFQQLGLMAAYAYPEAAMPSWSFPDFLDSPGSEIKEESPEENPEETSEEITDEETPDV